MWASSLLWMSQQKLAAESPAEQTCACYLLPWTTGPTSRFFRPCSRLWWLPSSSSLCVNFLSASSIFSSDVVGARLHVSRREINKWFWFTSCNALFRANTFVGDCQFSSIMPVDISLAIERKVSTKSNDASNPGPFWLFLGGEERSRAGTRTSCSSWWCHYKGLWVHEGTWHLYGTWRGGPEWRCSIILKISFDS